MNMETLIRLLHEEQCSCVICHKQKVYVFEQRGVADLYNLLKQTPWILQGAYIADKVVGKAAAALMIMGQVKQLYTDVISEPAWEILQEAAIKVEFRLKVPLIKKRTQTGWCPLETLCKEKATAQECFISIQHFINTQNKIKT